MAPVRSKQRASDATADQKVSARTGSPTTPHHRSPIKKRHGGISLHQKQALIDNLQLEITERARRLRAQYNLQAQGLRSRIEIRVNRIPVSQRKVKMGDILLRYLEQEEKRSARSQAPAKDVPTRANPTRPTHATTLTAKPTGRAQKRMSDAISGNKENDFEQQAKRRVRGAQTADVRPAQILSPTSSNQRLNNRIRPASPVKSGIARPASPLKNSGTGSTRATATNMLSSMVDKAKATRAGTARKVTTTSNTSSSSTSTTAATRTRRAAAPASRAPASRPATRNARRASANSETSDGSNGTVVKRGAVSKAAPAKKGVMNSIRRGVTGGTRKAATKTAAPAAAPAASTGRVLRKRG
ncbi:hypothetical protein QQZ08_002674 [Neonectria magnoliae]|uniref:Borealin N-terminal domain-containing protein n=1 Tax=Neonectria magnoliae TaxID=2732573 RepID=A0ABR1IBA6_9HYPO